MNDSFLWMPDLRRRTNERNKLPKLKMLLCPVSLPVVFTQKNRKLWSWNSSCSVSLRIPHPPHLGPHSLRPRPEGDLKGISYLNSRFQAVLGGWYVSSPKSLHCLNCFDDSIWPKISTTPVTGFVVGPWTPLCLFRFSTCIQPWVADEQDLNKSQLLWCDGVCLEF